MQTPPGYARLTEREKQTLRLLLDGHDAKSMARHLGLSVHTINERLRDARRKFAVSSSKEAARLLRRAEGAAPQSLGDTALGDADPAATGQHGTVPNPIPPPRRAAWAIGGTAMIAALAAMLALSTPGASPPRQDAASAPASASAVAAARAWLELGDAGRWDDALAATAASFRAANTAEVWRSVSQKVRVPLGRVESRTLIDAREVPTPPRGSWAIRFRTDFAGRKGAIETLSLVREDDAWKVVGIYIE